ncbi:MAG: 3-deoxy-D-manno-octulosonic acid transferase [Kiritimatiellae bacterium]|nr:3-deoxy-D-manno-octulosonic acid transferase [Kiritimatiellia bacterium]MCO5061334.1 3-deoxy-D-manno-octulosonic acid transferase [Kiritimatiellia bacterium]MCO5067589.1 3-deoxy-D-manno-octulosonic acid transferase [Kiritimatiellia bacterium]MCO6400156.1 3-deoxy-D-manno-octulosonic acid transferase [Verrucomicrobiota bacterium]
MAWFLYNILFVIGFTLMLPRFLLRMARRGGYAHNFKQRFGNYDDETLSQLAAHRRVWVHAVSVGEVFVALKLIQQWRERRPEVRFVLTTTTSTGYALAKREAAADDVVLYYPLDLPFIVRRVLDAIQPLAIVLVELELWPNLIRLAHERAVPILLANGRVSDRSFRGYQRLHFFSRRLLPMMDVFCVQTAIDRDRLAALGAPRNRIQVLGSAKYDVATADHSGEEKARALLAEAQITDQHLIVLGGSTWPGEEDALMDAYKGLKTRHRNLVMIFAPRHVERVDDVERDIRTHAMSYVLRSKLGREPVRNTPQILVLDTTGELKHFYSCADVIFIGKSLTQHGGQNPIEAALYGKPVICGPHMENFRGVVEDFRQADALIQVPDLQNLRRSIDDLLSNAQRREMMGARAAEVVEKKRGVLERTLDLLDIALDDESSAEFPQNAMRL